MVVVVPPRVFRTIIIITIRRIIIMIMMIAMAQGGKDVTLGGTEGVVVRLSGHGPQVVVTFVALLTQQPVVFLKHTATAIEAQSI